MALQTALERLRAAPSARRRDWLYFRLEDVLTPRDYVELGRRIEAEAPELHEGHARRRVTRMLAEGRPEPYERVEIGPNVALFRDAAVAVSAKTLIVAFAGRFHRLAVPNVGFLQALPAAEYDVAILTDPDLQHFRRGCAGYAGDFLGLVRALRRDLRPHAYRRAIAFGVSMGGLPAIRYALVSGTERAVCVAGRPAWDLHRLRQGDAPPHAYDPICACRPERHRAFLFVHSGGNKIDTRLSGAYASFLGGRTLCIPDMSSHSPVEAMWRNGTLPSFLRFALSEDTLLGGAAEAAG